MIRIKEKLSWLTAHAFVRKAVTMQIAGGAASVIQSLAGVILARVLKPDLFGQYSLAFSIASVASIALASGFQDALMPVIARGHSRGDAGEILTGFAYWAKWIGVSVVFVILVVIFLPLVTTNLYGNAAIGAFAGVILAASLVSSSILSVTQVAAQVVGRINVLALLTLSDMLVRYIVAVVLTIGGLSVLGASIGHLIGALIMAVTVIPIFVWVRSSDRFIPTLRSIVLRARSIPWRIHFSRGAWVWLDRNFGMLYQALPIAIVGLYVPIANVAFFKLAFGYLNTGMAVLGPVSILLNTEFARVQVTSPERLRSAFIRVSLMGMVIAGAVTAFAALVGHWVFLLLYGRVYMDGVPLVYGLILYGVIFGLGIGLGPMWRALNRVRVSVMINLFVLGIGVPLGLWLVHRFGTWGGVAMVTLWYGAAHLGSFIYLLRELRKESGKIVQVVI
ncbi:MAG TPA: oligosaccharide flippase family protein [Candidatus Paceibacterota bacterium]|nr:oligosaccharide flippase family protein [Candidatus Paceibacterota bacterium]